MRLISAFLDHLEHERGNSPTTRNIRLAAIRSLFRYAAFKHPEHAAVIERVLALPAKRFDRALITYLTKEEIDALLAAPDRGTWTGRRDHALLLTGIQTGLRVSELTGLRCRDIRNDGSVAYLYCVGKNRKERTVPLIPRTIKTLAVWLKERQGMPEDPLFPSMRGGPLSRDAVEWLIAKHTRPPPTAARHCTANGSPPTFSAHDRDDAAAIGHQHHRDRALARPRAREHHPRLPPRRPPPQTTSDRPHRPPHTRPGRYRATDSLLAFLDNL